MIIILDTDTKPRFEHDCESCQFLGAVELKGEQFDAYACFCGMEEDVSLIIRYGNSPEQNISGMICDGKIMGDIRVMAAAILWENKKNSKR